MTVTLIGDLLGEYQRCFAATERSLGLEFGREYLDRLTSAVNERSINRNSRLLVAGPLGEQISDDEYGSTNRTIIEAFAAAIVEAMVVAGVPKKKSQVAAAKSVAAALTKGGYKSRGSNQPTKKVPGDTVKRWHNKAKKSPPTPFRMIYWNYLGLAIGKAEEGKPIPYSLS